TSAADWRTARISRTRVARRSSPTPARASGTKSATRASATISRAMSRWRCATTIASWNGNSAGTAAAPCWRRRSGRARRRTPRPQALGLAVVAVSMAVFLAGQFAIELFLMRVSLIGVLAGSILYLWGPVHLRRLAFPLVLLLLAVPLPAVVLNQIAFPLQLLA